ncbi:MAG: hypothetical protein RSP_10660 [Rhodanobacter sp.]
MRFPIKPALLIALLSLAAALPALAQQSPLSPDEMFAEADANHDGVVTLAEFQAARSARFDHLDRNGDGYIGMGDIPALLRSRPKAEQRMKALIRLADTDHDGRVSRAEFIAAGNRAFALADRNHDGVVDKNEFEQFAQQARAMTESRN